MLHVECFLQMSLYLTYHWLLGLIVHKLMNKARYYICNTYVLSYENIALRIINYMYVPNISYGST